MATSTRRPGRPRGVQQTPAQRREVLLAAAEGAIRTHGANVSMEQIAERAGVSKATLYDNFEGKSGLTDALVERYGTGLLEGFAAGIDRPLTVEQVVRAGIKVFVRYIEANPEIYRFVVRNTEGDQLVEEVATPIAALMASVLEQQGGDPSVARAAADATLGAVVSATERWSGHRTPGRARFESLLADYVWAGLQAAGVQDSAAPVDLGAVARALVAAGVPLPPGSDA